MAVVEITVILVTLYLITIAYFKWCFGYWERKKVPFRKPKFPLGNSDNPLKKLETLGVRLQKHYDYFKEQGEKHGGIYVFGIPIYMPFDTEYIKKILVKDFDHFIDRGFYCNIKDDPLTGNVFLLEGEKWKKIRSKLTPIFTSGKIKTMFNILLQCSKQMAEAMEVFCTKKEEINMKDMIACFTTDVISSCAFGLECNSCKNPNEDFRRQGKVLLEFSRFEALRNIFSCMLPRLSRFLGVILVKPDVAKFFINTIRNTVEYRKSNNVYRKDYLQLLIELKNNNEGGMGIDVIAAEAFAFYVGGFETSSSTINFAVLELALNTTIQDRAREEVQKVLEKYAGEITYEALNEMTYVQQVLDETLRKYPILPVILRKCSKDYVLPDTGIVLDKGTRVFISTLAMQRDPDNFSDPETFDPERFSVENKSKIKPYTYMPFGEGPRNCIGLRFGAMQSKIGMATVLKNFKFTLNEKTKMPIIFNPNSFVLDPLGGIYLNLEKVNF